ncbi:MAG: AAA family ATPase [Novipirellula sp. JB048]
MPNTELIFEDERIRALCEPAAYPHLGAVSVRVLQTHISWVFLVGEFAYKVKKPIATDFLDYRTLERRQRFCEQEVRLDSRFAKGLYLDVVPITLVDGQARVEGPGEPIEYAVKMRRFPEDALLSTRLQSGSVAWQEVQQLASSTAHFHQRANQLEGEAPWGSSDTVLRQAMANFEALAALLDGEALTTLWALKSWTREYFAAHRQRFEQRVANGFIRECHGDLHVGNIVFWDGKWTPFDGIEFNEEFRWIDVMSDAAFLAMDLAAKGHPQWSRSFINAYLEQTGDHASLALLRWYLVYRALVLAKVAAIRGQQLQQNGSDASTAWEHCRDQLDLAERFSVQQRPTLWITHGFSGSGKTTQSELIVQRQGVIRLRSDVERKRHFGLSHQQRPTEKTKQMMYCDSAHRATYTRLRRLAQDMLHVGYSVVVDATFLKRDDRRRFEQLALSKGARFAILDCHADRETLRQRVLQRSSNDDDASDADLDVLESQLACHEPLTASESAHVSELPKTATATTPL